jgi:hypothetical protein
MTGTRGAIIAVTQGAVFAPARKGKVRAMRAMECDVGSCRHLHAETNSALMHALLTHTREVHPRRAAQRVRGGGAGGAGLL